MVNPISVIVGAITSLILPKAAEKFGEKLGDLTLEKSAALVQAVRQVVRNKLEKSNSVGLLTRAEEKPTEHNIRVLEAEIIGQVEDDPQFAAQLEALVEQASKQSSSFQIFLDGLRAKTLEIDKLNLVSKGKDKSEQIGGRDWQVQDIKIVDVSMESRNDS